MLTSKDVIHSLLYTVQQQDEEARGEDQASIRPPVPPLEHRILRASTFVLSTVEGWIMTGARNLHVAAARLHALLSMRTLRSNALAWVLNLTCNGCISSVGERR